MPKTRSGKDAIVKMDSKIDDVAEQLQKQLKQLKEVVNAGDAPVDVAAALTDFETRMLRAMGDLRSEVADLKTILLKQDEDAKRRSNQDYVVIHGLGEKVNEDLYAAVCDLFSGRMGIEVTKSDLNIVYRLGNKTAVRDKEKIRPVVVGFVHRWRRNTIFNNKTKLKNTKVVLSEMLTSLTLQLYREVKQKFGVKGCWTWKGSVYVSTVTGRRRVDKVGDIPAA